MNDKDNDYKGVFNMPATVQKWGNSLGVRIPKRVAEQLNVVNGSKLEFSIIDNKIVLTPIEKKITLEELMAQITPENQHGEVDWGKPEGNEIW